MPRDGWFVTDDRLIYQLINGSPYLMDEVQLEQSILDLQPGYYDQSLQRVETSNA